MQEVRPGSWRSDLVYRYGISNDTWIHGWSSSIPGSLVERIFRDVHDLGELGSLGLIGAIAAKVESLYCRANFRLDYRAFAAAASMIRGMNASG